ncbi:MAG: RraA family protein [Deltaproteobacteria bacterium]|nr:RraA family protein [Deltaproteobacteria bacterium]MBW2307975.1 RraA family protein [Deltaproteobacteria bacterium]
MTEILSPEELEVLRQYDTPTISNAIEVFDVRPRSEGFCSPRIRCMFPDLGVMVGYAVTATVRAERPASPGAPSRPQWWEMVQKAQGPKIAVLQDMDDPPMGSFWGEVQSNIHSALGCIGTVTHGGVRDLDAMRGVGFFTFATEILVSHAYIHMVELGVPVKIGGLWVHPGDLLHGDQHGVCVIPHEIARRIPEAVQKVEQKERRIIQTCQSPDFSIEKLREATGL